MKLLLIRHGQSMGNLAWEEGRDWDGNSDPELTPRGHDQAQALGRGFADGRLPRPDHLLTSLMVRAVQTVAPVSAALDMPVTGVLDVHEVGGLSRRDGSDQDAPQVAYGGLGRAELADWCPRLSVPAQVTDDGWYHQPIEPRRRGWKRARRVIKRLFAQYDEDATVAMVTHGLFINMMLWSAMGIKPGQVESALGDYASMDGWYQLNNTSTVMLTAPGPYGERLWVNWVNRTDHLSDDLLTQ